MRRGGRGSTSSERIVAKWFIKNLTYGHILVTFIIFLTYGGRVESRLLS